MISGDKKKRAHTHTNTHLGGWGERGGGGDQAKVKC